MAGLTGGPEDHLLNGSVRLRDGNLTKYPLLAFCDPLQVADGNSMVCGGLWVQCGGLGDGGGSDVTVRQVEDVCVFMYG